MLKHIFTKWQVGKSFLLPQDLIISKIHVNPVSTRAFNTYTSHRNDIDRTRGMKLSPLRILSSKQASCDNCHSAPATELSSEVCVTEGNQPFHIFKYTMHCPECWIVYTEDQKNKELEHNQKKPGLKERVESMIEELNRTISEDIEKAPIKYAATKMKSILSGRPGVGPGHAFLSSWLIQSRRRREDFRIEKSKKQYVCDKSRVDNMDLDLWLSYHWPLWDGKDG